jgi:outer membrane PBP1 activator LpoA protein
MAIYATSHAYSADGENKKNKDIEGLTIIDMPWILLKGTWQAPEDLIQYRSKKSPAAQTATKNEIPAEMIPVLQLPPPSQLYKELQQHWPKRMQGSNQRLFAFGIDIYTVIRYLQNLSQSTGAKKLAGMTGLLSLNARGVIQREMLWANIRYGKPKLHYVLPTPPVTEPLMPETTLPILSTHPRTAN